MKIELTPHDIEAPARNAGSGTGVPPVWFSQSHGLCRAETHGRDARATTKAVSPLRSATAVQTFATLLLCGLALIPSTLSAATNDLSAALQRGLFEEEGNRDLPAAISAYQSLAAQFDQSRQIAATAIFRLGECYRKLGKTNEAVGQYERIVSQFPDQATLVTLSRQNLAGLGSAAQNGLSPGLSASQTRPGTGALGNLESEYLLLNAQLEQIKYVTNNYALLASVFGDEKLRTRAESLASIQGITNKSDEISGAERYRKRMVEEQAKRLLDDKKVRLQILEAAISQARGLSLTNVPASEVAATDDEEKEIRRIQTMIQNSPDLINATGEAGITPLSKAAGAGWLRVVAYLLDHGAVLDPRALLYATGSGNKAMVELLIARGADLNARDDAGGTALHRAAEKGYLSVAETLIQHGANLEARNSQANGEQTPLQRAATQGRPAIATLLVAKGADVNARDAKGNTALVWAVGSRQMGVIEVLLKAGANPDVEDEAGRTALTYAAQKGDVTLVRALLAGKANPNAGKNGSTLFDTANPEILKLLLSAGAKPNIKNEQGQTPLLAVIRNGPSESAAVLIQHGADVNTANEGGVTPLHMAVWAQNIPTISLLLSNKADINAQHPSGRTALGMSEEAAGGFRPSAPGNYGGSSSMPDRKLARQISALLRQHGALDHLPNLNQIEVQRAPGSYSEVVFWRKKGTNDWNQFSLFEALATIYRMTTFAGNGSMIGSMPGQSKWAFPDLAHVKIRRATPDGKTWREIPVDMDAISKSGDCARDLPLEWGDVLEIPELDHLVTETSRELPQPTRELLARCLKRTVTVRIGSERKAVELSPNSTGLGFSAQFSVRWALEGSGLLRASSDTSRVKVTRSDAKTRRTTAWMVDASNPSNFFPAGGDPNTKLWLRDGDVIEVPEK